MKIKQLVKHHSIVGIATAVILLFTLALAKSTLAMPPLAVSLVSFTVTSQQNAALVEWETATELNAAGFAIERKRATDNDDQFTDIPGFINAEGDVAVGAEYNYLDETAVNGQTYIYTLIEYESNNEKNELDRAQITIGVQPTATPITVGGSSNTATPGATAVPSATATRRATATATRAVGATAVSPTAVPTARPTTATGNTTNPTATAINPTATAVNPTATSQSDNQDNAQSNNSSVDVAFAQEETPLPTIAAYPAETITDSQPADGNEYPPADTEQSVVEGTETPYPVAIEASPADGSDNGGVNVIGSGVTDNDGVIDAIDDNGGNSYLWIGFILALLIFIAGVVGTAVLFVRKK